MKTFTKYDPIALDRERVESLYQLMRACDTLMVRIRDIQYFMNGFRVTFEDWKGDAILHDGSYGHGSYEWETINFPWDEGDVSVHSAKDLAFLLHTYKYGEYSDGN